MVKKRCYLQINVRLAWYLLFLVFINYDFYWFSDKMRPVLTTKSPPSKSVPSSSPSSSTSSSAQQNKSPQTPATPESTTLNSSSQNKPTQTSPMSNSLSSPSDDQPAKTRKTTPPSDSSSASRPTTSPNKIQKFWRRLKRPWKKLGNVEKFTTKNGSELPNRHPSSLASKGIVHP